MWTPGWKGKRYIRARRRSVFPGGKETVDKHIAGLGGTGCVLVSRAGIDRGAEMDRADSLASSG